MNVPQSYSFETIFTLAAPTTVVWDALADYAHWKVWWKPLRRLEIIDPAFPQTVKLTIGSFGYTLTFTLEVTETHEFVVSEFNATGDLAGTGSMRYSKTHGDTTVAFAWDIATTKAWMNASAWLLRPVFVALHNSVMTSFARGLAGYLKVKLVAVNHRPH